MQRLDLSGKKFGRLTARERIVKEDPPNNLLWRCTCACGNVSDVSVRNLRRGAPQSCGCLLIESRSKRRASDLTKAIARSWATYRDRARVRKHVWKLTKNAFASLIQLPCAYCGKRRGLLVGVDRIDNAEGYIVGNCAPCCGWCNAAKMAHTLDEFKQWVREVYGTIFYV